MIEGEASALLEKFGLNDEDGPTPMVELCRRALGCAPRWTSLRQEAKLGVDVDGRLAVQLRRGIAPPRARWLIGHELAEWWMKRYGYQRDDIEDRADAIGACIAVPRANFQRAIKTMAHSVTKLARAFATTESLALLRVGETTGRPVLLLRASGPVARGDAFEWPSTSSLLRAMKEGRSHVHPVAIRDEPNRWGLMVRREVWRM